MKHCETCIYWKEEKDWQAEKHGFKRCHGIKERWKIEDEIPEEIEEKKWEGDTEDLYNKAEKEIFKKYKAYTQDASQYMADLYTAKDFGCVLHEENK